MLKFFFLDVFFLAFWTLSLNSFVYRMKYKHLRIELFSSVARLLFELLTSAYSDTMNSESCFLAFFFALFVILFFLFKKDVNRTLNSITLNSITFIFV